MAWSLTELSLVDQIHIHFWSLHHTTYRTRDPICCFWLSHFVDSGSPFVDSGSPFVDSGTHFVDSGTHFVDSGWLKGLLAEQQKKTQEENLQLFWLDIDSIVELFPFFLSFCANERNYVPS